MVIINNFYYSKGTKQKAKVTNKKYSILMNLFIDMHYLKSKLILFRKIYMKIKPNLNKLQILFNYNYCSLNHMISIYFILYIFNKNNWLIF